MEYKINKFYQPVGGASKNKYIHCGQGCISTDNKWRQVSFFKNISMKNKIHEFILNFSMLLPVVLRAIFQKKQKLIFFNLE